MTSLLFAGDERGAFEGWPLLGVLALGLAAMTAAVLGLAGSDEAGVRMLIRASARSSLLLFSLAFAASSLRRLWPVPASAWLLRNRRQLGLGFALSHAVHLAAIVAVARLWPADFWVEGVGVTIAGGGVGYLFLAAMAATSFDRSAAWLSRRSWRRLHLVGSWVLWAIFLQTLTASVFVFGPRYLPQVLLLLAVAGLRLTASRSPARRPA